MLCSTKATFDIWSNSKIREKNMLLYPFERNKDVGVVYVSTVAISIRDV